MDSLTFGHCDFSYRNLGRPSSIQIKHESNSFEVIVNHRQCFWSDKVSGTTTCHTTITFLTCSVDKAPLRLLLRCNCRIRRNSRYLRSVQIPPHHLLHTEPTSTRPAFEPTTTFQPLRSTRRRPSIHHCIPRSPICRPPQSNTNHSACPRQHPYRSSPAGRKV